MTATAFARPRILWMRFFACLVLTFAFVRAAEYDPKSFDIPADSAEKALRLYSAQSGVQVVFPTDTVKGVKTNAVKGEFPPAFALDRLLSGTALVAMKDAKSGALTIRREVSVEKAEKNAASRPATSGAAERQVKEGMLILDKFEVMGGKLLNMDKSRSRDDAQPYVIFNRDNLERSGAVNLNEFLRQRLTSNQMGSSESQLPTSANGSSSKLNLRGLGANQTLVLIDGRRTASSVTGGVPTQPDLNGIPVGAIERIEVLPASASGIYGGDATGGVVNIVLRRDYAGAEIKLTYDNSFDSDSAMRRVDLSTGVTFGDGKTNLLVSASYADANQILVQDRDVVQRGRAIIFANNPAFFTDTTTPPGGYTTNIRSQNGSPLFDPGTPNFTSVPVGYAGSEGLAPLLANAGRYNLDLLSTARSGIGAKGSLANAPRTKALSAALRHQFSPRLQAFLEGAISENTGYASGTLTSGTFTVPAAAPSNPFGQAVTVAAMIPQADGIVVSPSDTQRFAGGVIIKLPGDWQMEADYTWNRTETSSSLPSSTASATLQPALLSGALDPFKDLNQFPFDFSAFIGPPLTTSAFRSTLQDLSARFSGSVLTLPAGRVVLSGQAEHRDEKFADAYQYINPTLSVLFPAKSQQVDSLYLETLIPVVSPSQGVRAVNLLELQLAGRWDDYTLNGSNGSIIVQAPVPVVSVRNRQDSVNPVVAVKYRPTEEVTLRASYATGFLPPGVTQLFPTTSVTPATIIDPRRGSTPTLLPAGQLSTGGSPGLRPELSESWSAGLVLAPKALPSFRLSLDYLRLTKRDNVTTLSAQQVVDNESILPDRVTRGANLPGDQSGWAGPITALDATSVNVTRAELEAFDAAVDYQWKHDSGSLDFFFAGTWQTHYKTQLLPGTPLVEQVGVTARNPLKFKANAGVTWNANRWSLGWLARYFDSYLVADPTTTASAATFVLQDSREVSSQLYHDVFASYRFGSSRTADAAPGPRRWAGRMSDRLEIQVGIRNVFDKVPPYDVGNTVHYYSTWGDVRLRSYYVSVKKAF